MSIRIWLWCFCLGAAIFSSGCSKRDVPPPPKTQPELLLEIYDAARKHQYEATLLKIQKMRALDPTSIFLAELENTVRFNRLSAVVNTYLEMGKFEEALQALQEYENKYGFSDATEKTKARLLFITRLDSLIQQLKQAGRSEELEKRIADLEKLTQNTGISPKIRNFIQEKQSILPVLRKMERNLMLRELRQQILERLYTGDISAGMVLTAIYALEAPEQEKQILSVATGSDQIQKTTVE